MNQQEHSTSEVNKSLQAHSHPCKCCGQAVPCQCPFPELSFNDSFAACLFCRAHNCKVRT